MTHDVFLIKGISPKRHLYSTPWYWSLSCVINGVQKKKATGTKTAAGSRSMKRNLDTGVEVCDHRGKKNQRHTTNEKPNMYKYIHNDNQYFGL